MKYLIVDDDTVFRDRMVNALVRLGHSGVAAPDVRSATELLRKDQFDRVVVDLRMPGPSGLELVSTIRESSPETPVVVLTGFGSIATAQEAIRRGALSYLTKPCSIERIVGAFEPVERLVPEKLPIPTLNQVEWDHIQRILADCGGNVTRAAKILGIDRRSLQRRLAKVPVVR